MSDSKGIIAIAVALIGLVPSVLAFFRGTRSSIPARPSWNRVTPKRRQERNP
jgi:hypothetical protein